MKTEVQKDSVSLMEYARVTSQGYFAARDSVLRGEARGWQDARGRWRVAAEDATRARRRRESAAPEPPTA